MVSLRTMRMSSANVFGKISSQYSIWRPRYPPELFRRISELCLTQDVAWDCATGTGQAAVDLSQYFTRVEATDISAEQIAAAAPSERVHYSVQPAEQTAFPNNHFDLVTVAQALHWFDHRHFWTEVHRVLKPEGVFAAWAYIWPHVTADIDAIVTDKLLRVIHPYWSSKNQLGWDGYRALDWPFVELPAPHIEFSCDWTSNQFLSYLRTWSATTRCIEENTDGFFREFAAALRSVWEDETAQAVRMDFCCRLGRKAS
jgi:ubiquinone/menaquinone biosynthesis C-methylase UbiE